MGILIFLLLITFVGLLAAVLGGVFALYSGRQD
jgi:hypothetical protein